MAADRDTWASQIRKGVVELTILAMLREEEKYGSQLVEELSARPALAISTGTVYPLLGRLREAALVTTTWRESPNGPPRKYYALTAQGRRALAEMTDSWRSVVAAMDAVLGRSPS